MPFRISLCKRSLGFVIFSSILLHTGISPAQAQESTSEVTPSVQPSAPAAPETQAAAPALEATDGGIPSSALFRNTGVRIPGLAEPLAIPGQTLTGEAAAGDSFSGHFTLSGFAPAERLPLLEYPINKENAHLKLGPIYVHIDSLTGWVLYSHVANHPGTTRERWDSWIETGVTIMADLGEHLSFAVSGRFFYMPFDNRFGYYLYIPPVAGQLAYLFLPTFHAQLAYTIPIGGWPVTFADDLRIARGRYSDSFDYTFEDVRASDMGNASQNSTYTFGRQNDRATGNLLNGLSTGDFGMLINEASISTQKDWPDAFVFSGLLARDDFWYMPQQTRLPGGEDRLSLSLISLRENLRFKPFVRYEATHIDGQSGIHHFLRTGVSGPITEQLMFFGEVGFYLGNIDTVIGSIRLEHTVNPSINEGLRLLRQMSMLEDEVIDSARYEIRTIINPMLSSLAFVSVSDYNSTLGQTISHKELRAGVNLTFQPGTKTRISWDNYFGHLWDDQGHRDYFGTDLTVGYQISDTLNFAAVYSYGRGTDSAASFSSTSEHLVGIRLQKTFR